ncbi:MAG: hypothetical protein M3R63_25945 [Actinomycetota bacterium]|nr:hypothetical protein [Actinomycetota bacterium]
MSHVSLLTHRTTIPQEIAMLFHDALARARMREDQQYARQARLARRLASARRWRRIAGYAGRRAHRAAAGL